MATFRSIFVFALCLLGVLHLHVAWALPRNIARASLPDLYEASIAELQEGLEKGQFTSVDLVKVGQHILSCSVQYAETLLSGIFRAHR